MAKELDEKRLEIARRVSAALMGDSRRYASTALMGFFEGLPETRDPEKSMACVLLAFVCAEVDRGKLIVIKRDKPEKPEPHECTCSGDCNSNDE